MKHCPNPECGGIEKFKIVSEFNDTHHLFRLPDTAGRWSRAQTQ
jgi:hypothetical protein